MDIGKIDIGKIQAFLSRLAQSAGVAQTAADNAPVLGTNLLNYVIGSSPTSKSGFDGILAALTSKWSGDAADAFKAQAQTVRSFGIGVATLSDMTVQPQMIAQEQQYEAGYLTDYNGAATTLNQIFTDIHGKYQAATSGPNSFQSWTSYMAQFLRAAWYNNAPETQIRMPVPTFAEFVDGSRVDISTGDIDGNDGTVYNISGPGKPSGVLTLYTNPSPWGNSTSDFTYQNPEYGSGFHITVVWNVWPWETGHKDNDNQGYIQRWTQDSEFNNYLRKLMVDLGNQYPLVQAPPSQDNSVLPKTNGSSSSSQSHSDRYTSGFNVPGTRGAYGTGTNGSIPGLGNGSSSGGSYKPGGYNPGGYNPGSYNPGSLTGSAVPESGAGGWNPTQLAGFDPNAGGGLGSGGGFGAGGGPPGGSGVAGGAGLGADGGPGPGAGVSGAAGAGGRAMPMAPMGGMGGGKEGKERQRAAWLSEDEDVWGANDDGGDAVL